MKKFVYMAIFCTSFLAQASEKRGWYERLAELENNPSNKKNRIKCRCLGGTGAKADKNIAAIKKNPAAMKEPEPYDNIRKSGSLK